MSKVKVLLAMLALLLMMSAFARASTIIYNNGGPNQQNGNEMTEWLQSEDFTLTSTQTVTDVHFWDIEIPPNSYQGSITWWITGDDGSGNPNFNNVLLSRNTALVTRTQTQCGILGTYCEYSDSFDIPGLLLQGGTEYHLVLHNGLPTFDTRSEFYWETTNPNGTATGRECDLTTGACYFNWSDNGQEHAFYLTGGTSTPEPGTLALFGTSVVGIAGMLRRKLRS
jgi:PEP-CTERM motif